MSNRSHQIQVTKTLQLIDLNDNQNKCIATFRLAPSDITIPYDVAIVSQSMIDSAEGWDNPSSFKRFSGNVSNTVEIDDDSPQSYYLAIKSAPNTEEPLDLAIDISIAPSMTQAQNPGIVQPQILENFEDEIIKKPWYKTTWGIVFIVAVLAILAYLGYTYWFDKKDKDVRFKPLVQEKTYTPSQPIPTSTSTNTIPKSPSRLSHHTPSILSQAVTPPPSLRYPVVEDNSKSEYKTHKYRSRERIRHAFEKSESPSSDITPPPPTLPTPPPAPAPVPAPAPPVIEQAPVHQETKNEKDVVFSNRITSKLFEKLRGNIPNPSGL